MCVPLEEAQMGMGGGMGGMGMGGMGGEPHTHTHTHTLLFKKLKNEGGHPALQQIKPAQKACARAESEPSPRDSRTSCTRSTWLCAWAVWEWAVTGVLSTKPPHGLSGLSRRCLPLSLATCLRCTDPGTPTSYSAAAGCGTSSAARYKGAGTDAEKVVAGREACSGSARAAAGDAAGGAR
eukprot:527839-Rhodomonas_salina.1